MRNFEKRLKYSKYRGMDNIITINIHNGYTIIAIIGKDENDTYDVQLMLKENTVDKWDLIEKAEHVIFCNTVKNIYSAILKTVATYLQEGFFDYYINRYEYELKCFEIGNELEEQKRLGEKSYKPIKSKLKCQTVHYCGNCGDYVEVDHTYCTNCRVLIDWSDTD